MVFRVQEKSITFREKAKLRKFFKGSSYSHVDCIGYILARKFNVKFLTGDREFKGLENVEFVK